MSSSSLAHAPPGATARQSAVNRLLNLIVDPASAFRGIAQDPRSALPILVAVALRFGSLFAFYQPSVSPLKMMAGLAFQVGTVLPQLLLGAALVWFVSVVWQLGVRWRPTFSIVAHVYVAYTLITIGVASVAGAVLPETTDVDLRNPPFTNLVALAPGSAELVRHLLAELDVRSVYAFVLLWLGLRAAAPNESRSVVTPVIATIVGVRLASVAAVQAMR